MPGIARPIALVVVGMHRSGTSALSYCLSRVGASLPLHVVGASSANERGHWEPENIIALNDRYLDVIGSGWDDWRKLDLTAISSSVKAAFSREIKSTIRDEYPGKTLLMLKDPRISRMIPLYNEVLRGMGYEPRYVLCLRNPAEVVSSLSDRDGMTESHASLLWLRHMLDAELATRSLPRSVHRYDALLSNWRRSLEGISKDLKLVWPKAPDEAEADICSFLDSNLRHFWNDKESFAGAHGDWLLRAWVGLQAANSTKGRRELDAVREEFDGFCTEFGDQVVSEIYARQRNMQREIALHRENADSLATRLRAEVDRAQKAEALLAGASSPVPETEIGSAAPAVASYARAIDSDDSDAASNLTQRLLTEANEHRKNAERLAALLREEVESKLRADGALAEASVRHEQESAVHLSNAAELTEKLRATNDRAEAAEATLASVSEKLSGGEQKVAELLTEANEHRKNAERLAALLREEVESKLRADGALAEASVRVEHAEARIVRLEQEAAVHLSNAAELTEKLRATNDRAEAAEATLASVSEKLSGGEQKVAELLTEANEHRKNAERLAALLREEVESKLRADGALAEASVRVERAEARIVRLEQESAVHLSNAAELTEKLRATNDRAEAAEATLASVSEKLSGGEQKVAELLTEANEHRKNAERLAALLREEVESKLRADGALAEASVRVEHAEARIVRLEQEEVSNRESIKDLVARLRVAIDRVCQLEAETGQLGEQLAESDRQLLEERNSRELEAVAAGRLAADQAELTDRHRRMMRDHVALAERHEILVSEHDALNERLVRVETEHAEVVGSLNEAEALIVELSHQAVARASQCDSQALEESERHSSERSALVERLLLAEKAEACATALTADLQRAASDSEAAAAATRVRADQLEVELMMVGASADDATRQLSARTARLAELNTIVNEAATACGITATSNEAEPEVLIAVLSNLRAAAATAAARELAIAMAAEDATRQLSARTARLAELNTIVNEAATACGITAASNEAEPEVLIAVLSNLRAAAATAAARELAIAMELERSECLARDLAKNQQAMSKALEESATVQISMLEDSKFREAALQGQTSRLMEEIFVIKADFQRSVRDAEEREQQLVRDRKGAREELDALARGHTEDLQFLQTAVADRTAERDAAYDRLREAKSEKAALIQQMGQILIDGPENRIASAYQGELEGLRQEVRAVRNSTSWKATAPLRAVSRLFRRGRH